MKKNKFLKKLLPELVLVGVVLLVVFLGGNNLFFEKNNNLKFPPVALAGENDNIFGFAWSDTIGWISFNCEDGGVGQSDICDTSEYGVTVGINNKLSGYAWSDNIGWISFNENELGGCPGSDCKAKLVGNTYLSGWARALAGIDANDGWDGWISLSTQSGGGINYGVTLSGEDFSGFAWGSEVVGWISFNCLDTGSCGTSNYKVVFTDNFPKILTFQVDNTVTGAKPTADWTTENVVSCDLASDTGYSQSDVCTDIGCLNQLNFEIDFPVQQETNYTLTCYNGAGVSMPKSYEALEYFELSANPTMVAIDFVGSSATTTPPTAIGVTSYNGFKGPVSFSADVSSLPPSLSGLEESSATFSRPTMSYAEYSIGTKSLLEIFAAYRFIGKKTIPVSGNGLYPINVVIDAGNIEPIYEEI